MSPVLSFVIPVYQEGENIASLLTELAAATDPARHEILVVYDRDDDDTLPVLARLADRFPTLRTVRNAHGGGARNALRAGFASARGAGIWNWAGTESGEREPDVVLACAGDVPTQEVIAAASLLRRDLPELAVRVVNVVDMARLLPEREHPHGMPDFEFDALFTRNRPVIFAYHGYPWLIHRLTYRRAVHQHLHVRGYKEEGTTTTPFDMVVRNDLDRYRLVMDVIDRVPGLAVRAAPTRQAMADVRTRHHAWIREHGTDLPEVTQWSWHG